MQGSLIGHPVENLRVVLTDGSITCSGFSELAFKLAAIYASDSVMQHAKPVHIGTCDEGRTKSTTEFQGTEKRCDRWNDQDGDTPSLLTQGKGEFTMEYLEHSAVSQDVQMQLINTYKANKGAE
ncbi:Elongation factor G, mitochondrial [Ananas comosus]|uniref:Elongation factor G, mitochondrial n=1 Tax=Ananas comosus TaxID=4615 RepID=A0A199V630_ANACO|nr:Elongation factor G, mitochondrial [Ananas comosus]